MLIRHGVDIESVSEVRRLLDVSAHAKRRLFTGREVEECEGAGDSARHFAGRFCTKEALFKALGRGWQGMGWTEAEVCATPAGAPQLVATGRVRATLDALGVRSVGVSISHTGDLAMASVVLLCASERRGAARGGSRRQ
jgi:holo-[acyl-carrier protein] synthase